MASIFGVYLAAVDQQTVVQNAQDATTTGFLWAHVPSTVTGKKIRLRRVSVTSQHSTALATPTGPRLKLVRATFTGTPSGTAVTAAKVATGMVAPSLDLRTVITGLTPVVVAGLGSAALYGATTAVGSYAPSRIELLDSSCGQDAWPRLAPGEGIVIYQDTAGTASDTRKFSVSLVWDEVDA